MWPFQITDQCFQFGATLKDGAVWVVKAVFDFAVCVARRATAHNGVSSDADRFDVRYDLRMLSVSGMIDPVIAPVVKYQSSAVFTHVVVDLFAVFDCV